jgi:hypothetical protein
MSTEPASLSNVSRWPDDGDLAFLSFSLGPVQSFIASARTVRDLWTGSYLLSYLTFEAMRPILEKGDRERSFVLPTLENLPLWRLTAPGSGPGRRPSRRRVPAPPLHPQYVHRRGGS